MPSAVLVRPVLSPMAAPTATHSAACTH